MTAAASNKVPVTILTGFLGAGKTTLLNRILQERHGERIAVIENEFGEAGVDNDILVFGDNEQIIEMNNGCICCTVRGDLVRILVCDKDVKPSRVPSIELLSRRRVWPIRRQSRRRSSSTKTSPPITR